MMSLALRAAPPPMAPCPPCLAKPAGIEGHQRLRATALGSDAIQFACRDCGALWVRNDRSGEFAWAPVDKRGVATRTTSIGATLP